MQTDVASEDSSDSENSDSEDEEGKYAIYFAIVLKYHMLYIACTSFLFHSYERWIRTHQST